jgi:hypothetical protein
MRCGCPRVRTRPTITQQLLEVTYERHDNHAERGRKRGAPAAVWQLGYEASSRRGARRAGIVFTLILTVLGAWLCLHFLSLQLWA